MLNRAGLEERVCECYNVVGESFAACSPTRPRSDPFHSANDPSHQSSLISVELGERQIDDFQAMVSFGILLGGTFGQHYQPSASPSLCHPAFAQMCPSREDVPARKRETLHMRTAVLTGRFFRANGRDPHGQFEAGESARVFR